MSSNVAQREAWQAVTFYGLYPANIAKAHGVEQGTEMAIGYHAPTNTVLLSPSNLVEQGHWADYILGME